MGSTNISQPSVPAAPTTAQSMKEYVENYPALWNMQMQYAPQEAALQVDLAQQYAQPMGEALKASQEAMYPTETAITQQAGEQALQGMQSSELPDWAKQKYLDEMRANLGTNAGSGIGADYTSRNLLEQGKNWQDYYRNLGLSISGKQPVYSAQPAQYTNQMAGYTPQTVFGYNAQNYGNYANAYSSMYGANAQLAGQKYSSNMNLFGSAIGAGGAMGGAAILASSKRFKRNITLWA